MSASMNGLAKPNAGCLVDPTATAAKLGAVTNKYKLPYAIRRFGTWLPELEAGMVAASLNAAARMASSVDGENSWSISQLSHRGNYIHIGMLRYHKKFRPIVGRPDKARIWYEVCDYGLFRIARMDVKMNMPPKRSCLQIVGYKGSFAKFVGLALGLMLNHGIVPDRGDDAVLRRFYGVGGVVDETNEKHRAAASAALRRNPDIHHFFRPTLIAALL